MKLVQDKYGESIVFLDSGEDFHLPENEISKIRRQVIVLGYAGVVDLERGGADDFSSRSYFRRALYRPNIDTEIQLEEYRNLLFQIIDVSSDMMKGPIAKCELRRLPRDIHLRLVMNTLRDLHSSTGSMAIEAFYDSLGYSKSTGNKLCHEGYALQEFFRLRLIGDQSETIYEGLPADIGGCNMATMRHLIDFLSFKYISQISEITDIKCHQKRYQMLSNPSMSRLLNGEIVQNKIADLKVSCIRDLVKRLNKGEAIDDVLNVNCSNDQSDDSQDLSGQNNQNDESHNNNSKDDTQNDGDKIDNENRDNSQSNEDDPSSEHDNKEKNQKSASTYEYNALLGSMASVYLQLKTFAKTPPPLTSIHQVYHVQHGFLQLVNEGYRLSHSILKQDNFDMEFDFDEP